MPTPSPQLEQLRQQIYARHDYLRNHLFYLKDIENNKVSEEDVKSYLEEIFEIPVDKEIKHTINQLMLVVNERLAFYHRLWEASANDNEDQAFSLVNLLIEQNLPYCAQFKAILTSKKIPTRDKVQAAFNDHDLLKEFQGLIKPHLPSSYATLQRLIKVSTSQNTYSMQKWERREFKSVVTINWEPAIKSLKAFIQRVSGDLMPGKAKGPLPSKQKLDSMIDEQVSEMNGIDGFDDTTMVELPKALRDLSSIVERVKENARPNQDPCTVIEENVKLFFAVQPSLNFLQQLIDSWESSEKAALKSKAEVDARKKAEVYYPKIWIQITSSLTQLNKQTEALVSQIDKIDFEMTIEEHHLLTELTHELETIQSQIDSLKTEWPEACPQKIRKIDDIDDLESDSYRKQKTMEKQLIALKQRIAETEKQIWTNYNQRLESMIKKNKEESEEVDKKSQAYLQEKSERNKQRRAEIERKREEKPPRKIVNHKENLSFFSPEFQVDSHMEQRLKNLNAKRLTLLERILNKESPINAKKAYKLIEHLGGQIEEIGHGSSHKRIRLGKYYFELIKQDDGKQSSSSIATGGFFKQHGKQHTSSDLCPFNVKLIAATFERANITLESLQKLRNTTPVIEPSQSATMMTLQ
ncbi:hypothetical protein [Legionella taurinensis]|uniref:Uncharacterized protein n=1 Tax=Legionella taurinensis TaxID=70611 RepID=A0A3A5L0J5_9GAMM|nr:hypothetical protein [Legionella taurinensis]RJT43320.1 hypothetical protein D6J04_14455 [Legionella taurinensis]RJT64145.1 hypothetical protein D6J03_14930 [Legionella taurinensis]STY26359.1 Uncharacterised protein [Legionella taurinensis]